MLAGGAWKNFDDVESSLTLDELMLLLKHISRNTKDQFRMLAAVNGIEVEPDEEELKALDKGDEDLPEELLAMERERAERLAEQGNSVDAQEDMKDFLLGYQRLTAEITEGQIE